MDTKTTSLWPTHEPVDMSSRGSLWPGWETVGMIGRGSFGAVYEIQRDVFGDTEKAALKVISIPQNPSDIDELYNDGYDEESITNTFQSHLKSIVLEYSLMRKLNGCSNVVNCDDMRYVQHDDGIGWDIFIKMELLTPMAKAFPGAFSEDTVLKAAKDICAALILCKEYGIVHRDIKPQNIFVSPHGDFKLGDFGIAKTVEKTMGGTKIGTYKYMAPEVYNNQPYGAAADIYSLGLVLYWMLNERRMPFLPLPPEKLKAGMEEHARNRRFAGEPLPPPAHGSNALKKIVLKSCAFDPKDRYASPAEMLEDLNRAFSSSITYLRRNAEEERLRKEAEARRIAEEERLRKEAEARRIAEEERRRMEEAHHPEESIQKQGSTQKTVPSEAMIPLLVYAFSCICLLAVWIVLPLYIPSFTFGQDGVWIVLGLTTGWVIPYLAYVSTRKEPDSKYHRIRKKACTAAFVIQLVIFVTNSSGLCTMPYFPGANIWAYAIVISLHADECLPFILCLVSSIALVLKDMGAMFITRNTNKKRGNTLFFVVTACLIGFALVFLFYTQTILFS